MSSLSAAPQESAERPWLRSLRREELEELLELHDASSWRSLLVDWALIAASLALVARWPNPITVVLALFVIGGRQLGLAVLMHEAAHRTLFRNRRLNDWVGNWLCAYPVWGDLRPYRAYHLQHHAKTGTAEDPDLGLAAPFPVTRTSLRRKVLRDLAGRTGLKRANATLRRDLGLSLGKVRRRDGAGLASLRGVVLTNVVLFGLCALAGHPALYLLWPAAWLTTYSLVMRIRSIAEHGMVPDLADDLLNTRTTLARWWERLLIAPNRVNYHLEHHLLMTVPHYHLPRLHRLLQERGVLDGACITTGYPAVLRLASSRPEGSAPATPTLGPSETALTQRPPF
jgi:fatty acid desaturase